jgi:hypothetical protein
MGTSPPTRKVLLPFREASTGNLCRTFDRPIRVPSQDINHLAPCYAPLGARFQHAIDFVAECGQSDNFVIDGDQMRFGYGINGILAGQNALDDLDHGLMPIGRPRVKCSFVMRGDNIDKQVARCLFAVDFEFVQGNEKRFAKYQGPPSQRLH